MTTEKLILDPATTPPQSIYKLLIGSVVPRPIAFVSTLSPDGVPNLAPFSFFNVICAEPPTVCFSTGFRVPSKDTLANVKATGEFVVNMVSEEIAEQMNLCSGDYPAGVDEFQVSGLTPAPSDLVKPPYVLESHVNMECRLVQMVEASTRPLGGTLIIGEVVRFHIDGEIFENFRIDPGKLCAVGRMGGNEYTRTRDRFQMVRPRV
ncbi:MAG TPA: flavin reductase family protein [Bryobacteraceae bacterium]|jgi:flavin reductase (DIM6/NTAB) family NADH-FMN oxidoreductase RutF|nr:flavin reductase family protein [Bryobacteraceae bacterium]